MEQTQQNQSTLSESDVGVKDFLENRFGYAKVREFLADPAKGLHLDKTIMGTYARGQYYGESFEDINWKRKYPHVSKIHYSFQLDEIANQGKGRWYLQDQTRNGADYRKVGRLQKEIKQRRFFIANGFSLLKHTSADVRELAEQLRADFPKSHLDYSLENGFSVFVTEPDFCFYSSGGRTRDSNKVVAVSFNLNPDAVEEINALVERYNVIMHKITSK